MTRTIVIIVPGAYPDSNRTVPFNSGVVIYMLVTIKQVSFKIPNLDLSHIEIWRNNIVVIIYR